MSAMEHDYGMIMISEGGDLNEDGESVQLKRQGVDKRRHKKSGNGVRRGRGGLTGWRGGHEQLQRKDPICTNSGMHFLSRRLKRRKFLHARGHSDRRIFRFQF